MIDIKKNLGLTIFLTTFVVIAVPIATGFYFRWSLAPAETKTEAVKCRQTTLKPGRKLVQVVKTHYSHALLTRQARPGETPETLRIEDSDAFGSAPGLGCLDIIEQQLPLHDTSRIEPHTAALREVFAIL